MMVAGCAGNRPAPELSSALSRPTNEKGQKLHLFPFIPLPHTDGTGSLKSLDRIVPVATFSPTVSKETSA